MIRRFSAALIGLALTMPILAAAPVGAHTSAGITVDVDSTWTDLAGDTHVTGTVTNHTGSRRSPINVTATWTGVASETDAIAFLNLAPHATAPFEVIESVTDVSAEGPPDTVTATGTAVSGKPSGGLDINSVSAIAANAVTVSITNESTVLADDLVVYAAREGTEGDAAQSAAGVDLAAGATADFVVTFDAESTGAIVTGVIARTTLGTFLTSWNNFFGDLGNTAFGTEIQFLADEAITLGCSTATYCPTANVTREQMAIFLDRALELPDDNDPAHPFTDIGTRSLEAQQAIQNLFAAGITGGCTTTTFCPLNNVTRGQMSKFIVTGYNLPSAEATAFEDSFTDDDGHFSEPFNDSMKQAGITQGCGGTNYCPHANVTREQMARFLFVAETS